MSDERQVRRQETGARRQETPAPLATQHSARRTQHSSHSPQPTARPPLSELRTQHSELRLPASDFRSLFERFGPSLGLWRAAEIAALRGVTYPPPVLDLGCGDGIVTSMVLDRVDLGLDPQVGALATARGLSVYERLEPVLIEDAGLPDASFGAVLSNSVLEHVPNVDAVLAEVARILRPGARLVFTTPTEAFSDWLALPVERYADWRNRGLNHLNLWPVKEWSRRLERAGLEVEEVRPYLCRSLVTTWDALELLQQVWIGRRRLFSLFWRRIPPSGLDALARRAARLDLAAPAPGGGRLIVARKR